MRRFLQSSQRNLPLLLSDNNHVPDLKIISSLIINQNNNNNIVCRRPISCQTSSVVFQARKTTNYFDGHQAASTSDRDINRKNKEQRENKNRADDHDDNGKPKRGGSSVRAPGRGQQQREQQQQLEEEHETTGQKLARKFGWQTNSSKKMNSSPSQSKNIHQTRSSDMSSSSSSQFGSTSNNSHAQRGNDDARQTNKRQTRSSSILSSSSSTKLGDDHDHDHRQRRDHRASGSVSHDKQGKRFVLDLGDNQVARIDYKPVGGSRKTNKFNLSGGNRHDQHDEDEDNDKSRQTVIELYHTEVPEQLRGQGIGKQLARGAIECAAGANMRLKVTCDYLRDYVHRFASPTEKRLIIDLDKE